MKIQVLPKEVADKIAAGEVIERPVSVVKELVENSIDSGATDITVEITGGGKEFIRVTDNGSGIDKNEVATAFLRHATSKIRHADDLKKIVTLGFRGEALASIAAVSRAEIITKTRNEKTGTKLAIHGGEIISRESIGCPDGTTVIIRDLFYNLPVRHKFLKTESAESGQVIDMVSRLAITRTDVKFRLISNGKTLFTTVGNRDLKNALLAVFKDREYKELVPCAYEEKGIKITGFVSRPSFSRANRRSQFFFVNGRPVKNNAIEKGLTLGYKERLFEDRYPIAFIFVEINPSLVDVNIHPNKREVKFTDDIAITTAVSKAVANALMSEDSIVHGTDVFFNKNSEKYYPKELPKGSSYDSAEAKEQVDIKTYLSNGFRTSNIVNRCDKKPSLPENNITDFGDPDMNPPSLKPFDFDNLFFGDVIFDTYIIATDENNFYLFDQHAAHERVNYERLINAYFSTENNSQVLLIPFTFDVPGTMIEDSIWIDALNKIGYSVELFGDNSFIVREIPEFMEMAEAEDFIRTFVDEYSQGNSINNKVVIDKLITKSCKSSVKAHDKLNREEINYLIDKLKTCRNPFSCPHGRPTFIKFSLYEIERMFKRS